MKTETYTLPAFWASGIINADMSGMEDSEIVEMENWLERNEVGPCLGCSEDAFFAKYHDASTYVLACDCVEFTFQVIA